MGCTTVAALIHFSPLPLGGEDSGEGVNWQLPPRSTLTLPLSLFRGRGERGRNYGGVPK